MAAQQRDPPQTAECGVLLESLRASIKTACAPQSEPPMYHRRPGPTVLIAVLMLYRPGFPISTSLSFLGVPIPLLFLGWFPAAAAIKASRSSPLGAEDGSTSPSRLAWSRSLPSGDALLPDCRTPFRSWSLTVRGGRPISASYLCLLPPYHNLSPPDMGNVG